MNTKQDNILRWNAVIGNQSSLESQPGQGGELPASLPPSGVDNNIALNEAQRAPNMPADRVIFNATFNNFGVFVTSNKAELVLQADPCRADFLVQNRSTNSIFVGYGNQPDSQNGIEVPPGGTEEPRVAPVDAIWIRGNVTTRQLIIIRYGTF